MATEFRIMDDNLVLKSNVTVAGTSENVNFPDENLKSTFRSRVWRSTGYFEVVAGTNDKIDFTDSSSTVVATITAGNYLLADLITEIKTRMDAVSVDTFTVVHSGTTGRWNITSDGTTFELLNSSGANAADSILVLSLGYAASDLTAALTYTGANVAIHTVERMVIDLIVPDDDVDSVAVLFPERGSNLTSGAVVKIKANPTPIWSAPAVDVTVAYDDANNVINHFFTSDQAYRFWAIEITDPTNADLYVEIGGIILCKATQLDHGPEIGFSYSIKDTSDIEATDFGQEFANVFPSRKMFEFNLKFMPVADLETLSDIYNRVGNVVPFAIALDPTETLFDKERFFNYGKLRGELDFKQVFTSNFDTGLTHEETF